MTTLQRTFIYNNNHLPDPGSQYDNDQVRQFLASHYFPELAHCDIQVGEAQDGKVDITFVKRATTKGSHQHHLHQLLTLPAAEMASLTEASRLPQQADDQPTLAEIVHPENTVWVDDLVEHAISVAHQQETVGLQCHHQLPAHPLLAIPRGF